MRPFLDDTPDMCQSEQTKDCAGGHDIGFHRIALTALQCVAVHLIMTYAGGVREPFVAGFPGRIPEGLVDGLASTLDS